MPYCPTCGTEETAGQQSCTTCGATSSVYANPAPRSTTDEVALLGTAGNIAGFWWRALGFLIDDIIYALY